MIERLHNYKGMFDQKKNIIMEMWDDMVCHINYYL